MADAHVTSVEIRGQRYPIRSTLDAQYVAGLALYVDEKIRAATESTPSGDTVRLTVLAALNIADELFRAREELGKFEGDLPKRIGAMVDLLDALGLAKGHR